MGLYITLAGLLVVIIWGSVFSNQVAISVHTMLWHGAPLYSLIYFSSFALGGSVGYGLIYGVRAAVNTKPKPKILG